MILLVRTGVVVLQVAIVFALAEGVRRRNIPAAVNAVLVLCTVLFPIVVDVTTGTSVAWSAEPGPQLTLWIAGAGLLHSVGMLGLYESTDWWDHLTHTCSAALLTALVYAGVIVVHRSGSLAIDESLIGVVTVLFVLLASLWWELIELFARDVGQRYGIEPILVYYGLRDTALDLAFDLVGILLVLLFDVRLFVPIAATSPQATENILLGSGAVLAISTILLAVIVGVVFDTDDG